MIASPDDYTYDDLDRLTEVDYHNGEDEQFTYDKLGNRETVKMREGGDVDYHVNDLVNQYAGIGAPPGHWKLNDKPGVKLRRFRNFIFAKYDSWKYYKSL